MKHKVHLRDLLVRNGLAETSDEAERLILAAQVRVQGEPVTQAGMLVAVDSQVELEKGRRYVSRGGQKLEGALFGFMLDVEGRRCIDVGASTGGFTDCLLQAGALEVTAVDVGYGQFDWKLRTDNRVTLFERTNIAHANPDELGAPFDLLVADLSFTSLARLTSCLAALVRDQGTVLTLVKPQFELPKDVVKDGVVREKELHVQAIERVLTSYETCDLIPRAVSSSPIRGAKGNIEFWIWAVKNGVTVTIDVKEVVRCAHGKLSGGL